MKTHSFIAFAMAFAIAAAIISASHADAFSATICLRDRSSFQCKLIRETPQAFEIQREGGDYNILHKFDVVKKADIYAIIDDAGFMVYPDDLSLRISADAEESLSSAEFQRKLLNMQNASNERLGDRVGSIRTVLWLQFVVLVTAGALVALGD